MKIETEAKYILQLESYRAILDTLEANIVPYKINVMEYFFLDNLRFRSSKTMQQESEWEAFINLKIKIDDRSAKEFEYQIPLSDYEEIAKHIKVEEMGRKFRISFDDTNGHWDIDYYCEGPTETRILLAECEFEIDNPIVPPYLQPFILWQIPFALKNEWSSKKLMSRDYRENMLTDVKVRFGLV